MNKELLLAAIYKLLNIQQLTDDEMQQLKMYFTASYVFSDMPDADKQSIMEATVDTFHDVFSTAVQNTARNSLSLRFGI